MAATLHHHHLRLASLKPTGSMITARRGSRRLRASSVRCSGGAEESRRVTVRNGDDSLEICRVLNGMWQTSGGWGRIDRDDAVDAMLRYADAGLSTFDMADHCMYYIYIMYNIRCQFLVCLCVFTTISLSFFVFKQNTNGGGEKKKG